MKSKSIYVCLISVDSSAESPERHFNTISIDSKFINLRIEKKEKKLTKNVHTKDLYLILMWYLFKESKNHILFLILLKRSLEIKKDL